MKNIRIKIGEYKQSKTELEKLQKELSLSKCERFKYKVIAIRNYFLKK